MASSHPLLDVDGVSVRYGGIEALKDVSLRVDPGEILGVIGPNGSGKTTLLDCISGVAKRHRGEIRLAGEAMDTLQEFRIARSGIRRTFQNTALFEDLSVLDNVRVGADHRSIGGGRGSGLLANADTLLEQVGLTRFASVPARALSTGYRKRVEIARALAGRPSVLLLDEPTAGIQPADASAIMNLVKKLCSDDGLGVVLVEHNMPVIMSHSHRVIALHFGEVVAEGTPVEVQDNSRVQESYLGGFA